MNNDLISREALKEDLFIKFGNQLPNGLLDEIDNASTVEAEVKEVPIANISIDTEKLKELTDGIVERIKNGEIVLQYQEWIPVTTRLMTEDEEKEACERWGVDHLEDNEKLMFTCSLPDEGQEILISTHWGVRLDKCDYDPDYGFGLEENGDWDGVLAWMPLPEPYKSEAQDG